MVIGLAAASLRGMAKLQASITHRKAHKQILFFADMAGHLLMAIRRAAERRGRSIIKSDQEMQSNAGLQLRRANSIQAEGNKDT
jgi:hypothetical protein